MVCIDDLRAVFNQKNGETFLLSYNVSSYPSSDVYWWKSKDGMSWTNIAKCFPSGNCEGYEENTNITNESFQIKELSFPQNSLFYKCNASNAYGNDSKIFQLQVYGNVKRHV